jgi:RimJ/RimL family protein N-acetyltransferase
LLGLRDIVGDKIALTPFRTDYVESYCRWLNDPYIERMAGEETASPEQVLLRHRNWSEADDFVEYIICNRDTALPIGDVSLDFSKGPPQLGIMIGEPPFRRTGRASEAVRLIAQFARELGAERLVADIYDFNDASLKFHHRLGFLPVLHDIQNTQWVYEKLLV